MTSQAPLLFCDLTQSYSPKGGGGIGTYLREKRRYVLDETPHRLLQIVPGPQDRIVENGRHVWVEVGAPQLPDNSNYRFILRTGVVRRVLERYRPDAIESLCPWLLPWTAINHRRAHPQTTLVAGYRTDFPNAHIYRVGRELVGRHIAAAARRIAMAYAALTYRQFDGVYALGEESRRQLGACGIGRVDLLTLGVDTRVFNPARRDPSFRTGLGLPGDGPLLVYAGRMDNEKRVDKLTAMMRLLPPDLGAALVMIGDGKQVEPLKAAARDLPVAFRGFLNDRAELAHALASGDIYVSAMADETFGISVIEAQACGLPVVGVAGGAMVERVPAGLGLLGPVDDAAAMARNVAAVWHGECDVMARAARDFAVRRYSWRRTFEQLFEEIYPAAMARAEQRTALPRRRLRLGKLAPSEGGSPFG